jgi:hypothetical protein
MSPNKRGAGKGGFGVLWRSGPNCPALPDRERSAKMMRTLTLAVFAVMLVSCKHVTRTASFKHDLDLCLDAAQQETPVGTSPRFRLTLKNVSDHACRVIDAERRVDLQRWCYRLWLVGDSRPIIPPGLLSAPPSPLDTDWLEILPGSAKTFIITGYPEWFDTLGPGVHEAYVVFWRDPSQGLETRYDSPRARFVVAR